MSVSVSVCLCVCECDRGAGGGRQCRGVPALAAAAGGTLRAGARRGRGRGAAGAPLALAGSTCCRPGYKGGPASLQPVLLPSRFDRDAASSSAAAMAIDALLGKWCLVSSEGFEEYMKELGKKPAAPRPREGGMDAGMPPRGCAVAAGRRGSVQGLRERGAGAGPRVGCSPAVRRGGDAGILRDAAPGSSGQGALASSRPFRAAAPGSAP